MTITIPHTNRRIVLRSRPDGLLDTDDIELTGAPIPELADGQALGQVLALGMDAATRAWLQESDGYLPAVGIGEVIRGAGVARVVASRHPDWAEGDLISCLTGWQEWVVLEDAVFPTPWKPEADPLAILAVHGSPGAVAYFGLTDVAAAREGDDVVVSAAAGATGVLVGQIAKILGCRAIGIAGSDEKCAWLVDEMGFDEAINRRTADLNAELKRCCPGGVDVYFDNVGGEILDAVLRRLANGGRIALCGAIASYLDEHRPPGPANYQNLIGRRGRMQGFLMMDYIDRMHEVSEILDGWIAAGQLQFHCDLHRGLESCPEALNALFTGANKGKSAVALVDGLSPSPVEG
ncbi:MAG: NADP-dependent oxidoreductase [Acidimicrobiia bacterium]|nr:NADP-dependent oxidoreductase [Acidimicrobiia bacterium]